MRMKLKMMVLFAMISPMIINAAEAGTTKISMAVRARNTSQFDATGASTANYTSIERGYLTAQHNITENIKGKVTFDVVSNKDGVNGASIRLKNAYIDFANLGSFGLTAGLATNYFGMTRDISSSFIYYKAGAEKWFSNASTDYGVTLHGKFGDMVKVQVQGVNGNGYKHIAKDKVTKYPDLIANARITPVKAFMLGLSFKYDKVNTGNDNMLLSPHTKISTDYIDIPVEAVINLGDSTTYKGRGYSVYVQPELKLKKLANIPLSIGGGFGILGNKDEAKNATVILAGLKYDLVKGVKLQTAYVNDLTNGESTGSNLMFQIEYKFSSLIK